MTTFWMPADVSSSTAVHDRGKRRCPIGSKDGQQLGRNSLAGGKESRSESPNKDKEEGCSQITRVHISRAPTHAAGTTAVSTAAEGAMSTVSVCIPSSDSMSRHTVA